MERRRPLGRHVLGQPGGLGQEGRLLLGREGRDPLGEEARGLDGASLVGGHPGLREEGDARRRQAAQEAGELDDVGGLRGREARDGHQEGLTAQRHVAPAHEDPPPHEVAPGPVDPLEDLRGGGHVAPGHEAVRHGGPQVVELRRLGELLPEVGQEGAEAVRVGAVGLEADHPGHRPAPVHGARRERGDHPLLGLQRRGRVAGGQGGVHQPLVELAPLPEAGRLVAQLAPGPDGQVGHPLVAGAPGQVGEEGAPGPPAQPPGERSGDLGGLLLQPQRHGHVGGGAEAGGIVLVRGEAGHHRPAGGRRVGQVAQPLHHPRVAARVGLERGGPLLHGPVPVAQLRQQVPGLQRQRPGVAHGGPPTAQDLQRLLRPQHPLPEAAHLAVRPLVPGGQREPAVRLLVQRVQRIHVRQDPELEVPYPGRPGGVLQEAVHHREQLPHPAPRPEHPLQREEAARRGGRPLQEGAEGGLGGLHLALGLLGRRLPQEAGLVGALPLQGRRRHERDRHRQQPGKPPEGAARAHRPPPRLSRSKYWITSWRTAGGRRWSRSASGIR